MGKEHARFIGRVIFANFLNLPLDRYRNFIKETERYAGCLLKTKALSKAGIAENTSSSSCVIAKIEKTGRGFRIRYTYEGFNKVYPHTKSFGAGAELFYRLRRIGSRNEITHRLIRMVVKRQKKFFSTSDPVDLTPLSQSQLPIDNSWISRLVNRLSVIIPSGEERTLRSFFPTQKDINKRFIKQLLDKEKEPLTDNEIVARLKSEYGIGLSRHSVGHCRKDMGIPPAKRRLSGYKYPPLSANFSVLYPLVLSEVLKNAPETSGVYEFSIKRDTRYEQRDTVFYIGSTRNIRKRLREHLGKNGKNSSIRDYLNKYECFFRFIQVQEAWQGEEERLYKLFRTTYGSPPRCNRASPVGNQ